MSHLLSSRSLAFADTSEALEALDMRFARYILAIGLTTVVVVEAVELGFIVVQAASREEARWVADTRLRDNRRCVMTPALMRSGRRVARLPATMKAAGSMME